MNVIDPKNLSGLSEREAAQKLKEEGYNELAANKPGSFLAVAIEVASEPMFLLLVSCGFIYLLLGDYREALMLLGFVFVAIGITLYQENKAERALEALRNLSSPRALVIRDGKQRRIPGREVVRDDVLVLNEGDRIPADGVLLWASNVTVDESLLTGESVPVRKISWDGIAKIGSPGGDDLPFIYAGTLMVKGQGVARVQAVGSLAQLGIIGKALQTIEPEGTLLQKETRRLVRNLTVLGISLCAVAAVVYGFTRQNWLNGFLAGLTLAMAMLPEEFPVVLTVFLAIGAWRLSERHVLTRRMPAVEMLGSTTVLCVDKTGTLTLNQMSVSKVFAGDRFYNVGNNTEKPLPEALHELVEFSILASQRDPFDPMERALKQMGEHFLSGTEHLHDDWTIVREYPLSKELLALSHVWQSPSGTEFIIAAKGAPEAIADLCHLDQAQLDMLSPRVSAMAGEGLRVLAVAKASFEKPDLPGEQHTFSFEFLGLVGFSDPVRPGVPEAVRECYAAGVRIIMITGDYPATAQSIARQIGLRRENEYITGPELQTMKEDELRKRIKTVNIFARIMPEQKLKLVEALKADSEVVAMTGDGVNDAPALKAAHIGIAMGGRGTDVARESASLVLLNDDFASIVNALRHGRRIFENLRKAMAYIFAIHVPIAGMSLLPIILGWPLVFFPVHIAFLELIIDPACSVVFEAEPAEKDVMTSPPRNPKEPLFGKGLIWLSVLQGISVLVIILGVFAIALYRGQGAQEARTLTFTTLIIANLGLILTNRSWSRTIVSMFDSPNSALWWVVGGALVFLGLVLNIPFLRVLFHFSRLHPADLIVCVLAGIAGILWFEGLKVIRKRYRLF